MTDTALIASTETGQATKTMPVVNPATGEVYAHVPALTAADVDAAVNRAVAAFATWRNTTPAQRQEVLLKAADAVVAHGDEIAAIESRNTGKPLPMATEEVGYAVDMLRFFSGAARRLDGIASSEYAEGFTSILRREPLGVVGVVAPWNYPFMLTCVKLAAVLAAGNSLVLKPADDTPMSAIRLAEILADIIPDGVFQVVTGTGPEVGQRLVENPDISAFALTGGTETGSHVAQIGAKSVKRMHLELGSKNAALVFDDANVEEAAEWIAIGAFVNSGQDCGAAGRVYVHDSVYDQFLEAFLAQVDQIVVGGPEDENATMGPVLTHAHQQRVLGFIERARAEGGQVIRGGAALARDGFFIAPTVVLASNDSELAKREVFGPVVSIHRVSSDEEAIAEANDVDSALAAGVFTNDVRRAMNAMRDLDFGTTWSNTYIPMATELPWGGYKKTGNGHDQSAIALEEFTRVKHVMIKL